MPVGIYSDVVQPLDIHTVNPSIRGITVNEELMSLEPEYNVFSGPPQIHRRNPNEVGRAGIQTGQTLLDVLEASDFRLGEPCSKPEGF